MASLFRRFPSDDLSIESGDWDVSDDGQILVLTRRGEITQLIADDFFEAPIGGPPAITGTGAFTHPNLSASATGTLAFSGSGAASHPNTSFASSGTLGFAGDASVGHPVMVLSAAGEIGFLGNSGASFLPFSAEGIGVLEFTGGCTLEAATMLLEAEGNLGTPQPVTIEGELTFQPLSWESSGDTENPPPVYSFEAEINLVLSRFQFRGRGTVPVALVPKVFQSVQRSTRKRTQARRRKALFRGR